MSRETFKSECGTVLLESVVMLPVVLLAVMAAGQMAHIWFARQLMTYAAWTAARAAVVQTSRGDAETAAESAALDVCSTFVMTSAAGSLGVERELPLVGAIPGSRDVSNKVTVSYDDSHGEYCTVTVTAEFPLLFPVINHILSGLMAYSFTDETGHLGRFMVKPGSVLAPFKERDGEPFPLLVLSETAVMPRTASVSD